MTKYPALPSEILARVSQTIEQFNLIEGNDAVVAFSGGKDSITACVTLRELGFNVTAVSIDMGYNSVWAERIKDLGRKLALDVQVVSAADASQTSMPNSEEIRSRLTLLGSSSMIGSPCTHCYSVKALSLDQCARILPGGRIVFGHHLTDATASMLKEAIFYLDRWDFGNIHYYRPNFLRLATQIRDEAVKYQGAGPLVRRLATIIEEHGIVTDEPPRQHLRAGSAQTIVRPLFFTDESDCATVASLLSVSPEGSGCGHSLARSTFTPREIVQWELLSQIPVEVRTLFANLVLQSISGDGSLPFRSRSMRAALLGEEYRPHIPGYDKI